ncbi:MAG: electron transport complex subunit RsxC [bacterium]|nr:electron transport complex subunit RsxC [bacterium]
MKLFRFRGGVHPPDYKALTQEVGIERLTVPRKVRVPLVQHLGVAAQAVVKKGERVLMGQLIGERHGFVSAAVHAPVSGVVTAVESVPHVSGRSVPGIEIENDGKEEWHPEIKPVRPVTREAIIAAVQAAGIVGMGGATFPTHVKLQPPEGKKIVLLILNGAECEPFLTCDYRLMVEAAERVIRGAVYLMEALGVTRCVVGIEDNKPAAIAAMRGAAAGQSGIEVESVRTHYPQGGEKQLIYALTGREVPSGGLPMDVGCVVQNVGTAAAVADAVETGRPLIERIVTVSGDAVERPGNYVVRVGTSIGDVLAAVGVDLEKCAKVIAGGPMTGLAVGNLEVPVTKGTSGILAFTEAWVKASEPAPCVRCGRCGVACPIGLNPTMLETLAMKRDVAGLQVFHAQDCIECGCCAYICPSQRTLVQAIRYGKAQIVATRKAKRN